MMNSMTAFGRHRADLGGRTLTVEIKSVNSRYFDFSARMPRAISYLEEKLKPYLQSRGITRGKIEVSIQQEASATGGRAANIVLNETVAAGYIAALRELRDKFGLTDDISVMSVARNTDIFITPAAEEDADRAWEELRGVLDVALDVFLTARRNEGARLEADMVAKLDGIAEHVAVIEANSAREIAGYRDKLMERLQNMLADNKITIDENRILTECAIAADKLAIDEELVRLRSHFDTFREITASEEPVGRRLDFLMQEINRETNTIGSKCGDLELARTVVNIKAELEKIREQIQNIE
jgi:uncharacterized protein (TIGR00255 family)